MLAAWIVPGIEVGGFWSAMWIGIVIGLLNFFVRPLMLILTIPVTLITFGLFVLVLNGVLVLMAGEMIESFVVDGYWAAFWFALIYGIARTIVFQTSEKNGK